MQSARITRSEWKTPWALVTSVVKRQSSESPCLCSGFCSAWTGQTAETDAQRRPTVTRRYIFAWRKTSAAHNLCLFTPNSVFSDQELPPHRVLVLLLSVSSWTGIIKSWNKQIHTERTLKIQSQVRNRIDRKNWCKSGWNGLRSNSQNRHVGRASSPLQREKVVNLVT